jgi:phage gp36-like protein
MAYVTLTELARRFGGAEVLMRAAPDRVLAWRGEAVSFAAVAAAYPLAAAGDAVLAVAEDQIATYSGTAWALLALPTLDQAIGDAGAEIDGYLAARYQVPLAPQTVTPMIRKVAGDLARFYLFQQGMTQIPDAVADQYKGSRTYLASVGRGDLALTQAAAPADPGGLVELSTSPPVFGSRRQGNGEAPGDCGCGGFL